MLSDEKFYDKAVNFCLVKNTEGFYYTLDEYRKLTEGNQTDKDGQLCYLYSNDKVAQYSYIEAAKSKGYDVLEMNGQLDTPFMNQQEQKQEKCHFSRIDADTLSNLIRKADAKKVEFSESERRENNVLFSSQIPECKGSDGKVVEWTVDFQAMDETDKPVMIAQNEWMRRMKEMSRMQPGMNYYGMMPESYNLIVNTEHPAIKRILTSAHAAVDADLLNIVNDIKSKEDQIHPLEDEKYKAKAGEFAADKQELLTSLQNDVTELKAKESEAMKNYGKDDKALRQLIDLALLEGGMLKGEALATFIKRSTEML